MTDNTPPVALVTGAARRIGAVIARHLHAAGYDIALHCHRSLADAQALKAELDDRRPGSVELVQADLARFDASPEIIARSVGRFGRLDALINNASVFHATPVGPSTPQQFESLFSVNVRAPFFLSQAAAPHLKRSGGSIVNITDLYARQPLQDYSLYAMSKAALAQMTRALAVDLAPGVRVNAVAPGAILWPEDEAAALGERERGILERTPLARTGEPEEVAAAVLWLLRDAGFITGHSLPLDGGRQLPG